MIRDYIKIAFRNLQKNMGFSAVNILGLSIAMTAVLLIAIWVQNQFLYDNFYVNNDNIYKLYNRTEKDGNINVHDITMGAAADALKEEYPEVEYAARQYWSSNELFTYGEQKVKSKGNKVDADFLRIFDFPVLEGSIDDMLRQPNDIVLTEGLAKQLFGNDNPMNQIITMGIDQHFRVSGVLRDLPKYTDFDFNYLVPFTQDEMYGDEWTSNTYFTFVTLRVGTNLEDFNNKIKPLLQKNSPTNKWSSLFLYPMEKQYLYSRFENGISVGGRIEQVRLVGSIGLLILLIACINYINLSTARSQKRSREVGVRKVTGASNKSLIGQFLFESILLSSIAGAVAILLTILCVPVFNSFLNNQLVLNWTDPVIYGLAAAFVVLVGVLAGLYPAFVLSSFKPIKTLKGQMEQKKHRFNLRESLVIIQFGIALFLVVATFVIHGQVDFAGQRNVGYNQSQLIEIPVEGELEKNYEAIKSELLTNRWATDVTRTGWTVTGDYSNAGGTFSWEGATPEEETNSFFTLAKAERDFVKTLGLMLIDGRDIDYPNFPADSASVLLNETAVQRMNLEDPVGKYLKWGDKMYTIVGILKDHIIGSPYEHVRPLLVYPSKQYMLNLIIRTNAQFSMSQNLLGIENTFKKFNPAYPFTYSFVDEQYAKKFHDEQQIANLTMVFSLLAIFISCLGLFGLAYYIAETRTREIGIRKVLGASVSGIVTMLSKDFVKLVCLAIIIASPIAWWAMNKWLEDFAYKIDIEWWMFGLAGLLAITVALLTVSGQAIRAAIANPVESLRDE